MFKFIQMEQPTIIIVVVIELNTKKYGGHFEFKKMTTSGNGFSILKLGKKKWLSTFPQKRLQKFIQLDIWEIPLHYNTTSL